MTILTKIQNELKAPKNQYNSFGKYKYRNAEDIMESLKPLLEKYEATVFINDEIVQVGERYYVKATATFVKDDKTISVTAFARESLDKKGMDDSQITGACSSYARKYALGGLFLVDDTKDTDSEEYQNSKEKTVIKTPQKGEYQLRVDTFQSLEHFQKELENLERKATAENVEETTKKKAYVVKIATEKGFKLI